MYGSNGQRYVSRCKRCTTYVGVYADADVDALDAYYGDDDDGAPGLGYSG